jgi:hyperosmotically inducible periplasmic protein
MTTLVLAAAPLLLALAAAQSPAPAASPGARPVRRLSPVQREVLHELTMLPRYGVFDNLSFKVDESGVVTLLGQVRSGTLKSEAERAVKDIEGVREIKNDIEILPASTADDQIRLGVYRAVYGTSGLDRYALQAVPPIHIVVKRGRVALEGVVASEMDKNLAGIKAREVGGTFEVVNNLVVEKD